MPAPDFYTGTLGLNSATRGRDARFSGATRGNLQVTRWDFIINNALLANGDTIRCGSLTPTANIWSITAYVNAMGTGGSIDIGWAKAGANHDGDVVEVDTFADGYDCSSAVTADIFTAAVGGGGVGIAGVVPLTDLYRGLPLWQYVNSTADIAAADGEWDCLITLNNKGVNAFTGTIIVEYSDS